MRAKGSATDEIELDLGRYELRRHGARVRLEKKPMELLLFLVGRRDQLVTREDIAKHLWRSDLFIETEPNINNIVRKLRTALGDDSARNRFIETVVGKGYRFVGPIRVVGGRLQQPAVFERRRSGVIGREPAPSRDHRPSLAVLPLVLLGNTTEDRGLCLGFADALTTRLASVHALDVLPLSTVMNLPATITPKEVGSRLGVRFVVHGAIQESKRQWRLSLELFDTQRQQAHLTHRGDLDPDDLDHLEDELAHRIAAVLNRPLRQAPPHARRRYSKDPVAYAEFTRGYGLSFSGDPASLQQAVQHLSSAVARDPNFSLAHATLSLVCATHHFESDPASTWLEKAEFHCRRALEDDPDLPEGHMANAFLLWGPSKNFQHLEAIAELRRAITLQNNLPHAYNRLGTILAHIGLLDRAREMYERGRQFQPGDEVSHSIVQVYLWCQQYDLAREEIRAWRADSPDNRYALYYAPYPALMTGDWTEASALIDEALQIMPEEPLIVSMQGVFYALTGQTEQAEACIVRACANPRSLGHAHHTYYHIACTLALLEKPAASLLWLERSVSTGFACWPLFMKDQCLQNLRGLPEFEVLVSSLQARYPDHLGLL